MPTRRARSVYFDARYDGRRLRAGRVRAVIIRPTFGVAFMLLGVSPLAAQTEYRNSDGGRPLRLQDATPTERGTFELQLPAARVERFDAGPERWRFEPHVAYGPFSRAAVEVWSTFVYREPKAIPRGGMSTLGMAAMYALRTESGLVPAIALAGDLYQPMGVAKGGAASYDLRAMLTSSSGFGRVHLNATYGTYATSIPRRSFNSCILRFIIPERQRVCNDSGPPFIPDGPCDVVSGGSWSDQTSLGAASTRCGVPTSSTVRNTSSSARAVATQQMAIQPPLLLRGRRWNAGLGLDRSVRAWKTLLMADVFAERFNGLYALTDWTGEFGVRQQIGRVMVADAGVARHFAGTTHTWVAIVGATYSVSRRPASRR